MPFSSFNFILVLPLMILSYWALPPRFQKVWLVVLSLGVYLAAGWRDLALLFVAVAVNWAGPFLFGATKRVTVSLVLGNLGFLAWFKYRLFLAAPATWNSPMGLIIPLGISFYVFQLISYQVEVQRGQVDSRVAFLDFFLFIFFFPHHQAGPIMRPHAFLVCFKQPRTFFRSRMITGLMIFLWGLFKKVWIADVVAPVVDTYFHRFHADEGLRGNLLLLGVLFGIQVYGDFSGYSDMAVGLGRLFGYKFDRNFHQPYLAGSPSVFWNRWHVTLTKWMRDFVFFPLWNWSAARLSGHIRPAAVMLGCSLAVMLLTGLWHGGGWNFVLWGGIHGLLLVAWHFLPGSRHPALAFPKFVVFQLAVMLTWVLFREPNLEAVLAALTRKSAWVGAETFAALALFAAIVAFSALEDWLECRFVLLTRRARSWHPNLFSLAYGLLLFFVLIGAGSATTFIYQRF